MCGRRLERHQVPTMRGHALVEACLQVKRWRNDEAMSVGEINRVRSTELEVYFQTSHEIYNDHGYPLVSQVRTPDDAPGGPSTYGVVQSSNHWRRESGFDQASPTGVGQLGWLPHYL
jgi:hypothetical protein